MSVRAELGLVFDEGKRLSLFNRSVLSSVLSRIPQDSSIVPPFDDSRLPTIDIQEQKIIAYAVADQFTASLGQIPRGEFSNHGGSLHNLHAYHDGKLVAELLVEVQKKDRLTILSESHLFYGNDCVHVITDYASEDAVPKRVETLYPNIPVSEYPNFRAIRAHQTHYHINVFEPGHGVSSLQADGWYVRDEVTNDGYHIREETDAIEHPQQRKITISKEQEGIVTTWYIHADIRHGLDWTKEERRVVEGRIIQHQELYVRNERVLDVPIEEILNADEDSPGYSGRVIYTLNPNIRVPNIDFEETGKTLPAPMHIRYQGERTQQKIVDIDFEDSPVLPVRITVDGVDVTESIQLYRNNPFFFRFSSRPGAMQTVFLRPIDRWVIQMLSPTHG